MILIRRFRTFLKLRNSIGYKLKGYDIVFLKNLRSGGNTIQHSIEKYLDGFDDYAFEERYIKKYLFFMVCRNPYTKLLSNYYHCVDKEEYKVYKVYKGISFSSFVNIQCSLPDNKRDDHVKFQTRFLKYNPIILRFENLNSDWEDFCDKYLGYGVKSGHDNKSKKNSCNNNIWTKKLRDLVYETFRTDFQNFGYAKIPINKEIAIKETASYIKSANKIKNGGEE